MYYYYTEFRFPVGTGIFSTALSQKIILSSVHRSFYILGGKRPRVNAADRSIASIQCQAQCVELHLHFIMFL
jgi:hypothetical protein